MPHNASVTSIYDAHSFYLDLTKELQRLRSPHYPQREFFRALEHADHADIVRGVTAINAAQDACYFERQQSSSFTDLDDVDSRYLVAGYSPEKAVARGVYAYGCKKAARAARAEAISS
jgi:hypothetical protein